MSPAELMIKLATSFPLDATCWSQATDEIRDMSRHARETLKYSGFHAIDFGHLTSPSEWNTAGIQSIVRFYTEMDHDQRTAFVDQHRSWIG